MGNKRYPIDLALGLIILACVFAMMYTLIRQDAKIRTLERESPHTRAQEYRRMFPND